MSILLIILFFIFMIFMATLFMLFSSFLSFASPIIFSISTVTSATILSRLVFRFILSCFEYYIYFLKIQLLKMSSNLHYHLLILTMKKNFINLLQFQIFSVHFLIQYFNILLVIQTIKQANFCLMLIQFN